MYHADHATSQHASNKWQKKRQSTIGRSDNLVITSSRDNAWRVAREVETVPTTAFEKNTRETSGGGLVLRQNDALMVPNPREISRGGSASRESSGSLADVEKISPTTFSVRSNTEETSSSSLVRRQKDALMIPNPRENSRGGSASRDSSGRLANGENISPRTVSVRSNTGENPGSRPLQRQKDALMVPNPRENSRGGSASRNSSGRLVNGEKISRRIVSGRSNTERPPVVDHYSAKKMP